MLILTIRTDKPEAEIGLYKDDVQLGYEVWHAHRTLSVTLLQKIDDLLAAHGTDRSHLGGVVCYSGPGSFTGLRIGMTVADTVAYALAIPIVGIPGEDDWIQRGLGRLRQGEDDRIALPEYGAPVHITAQKK